MAGLADGLLLPNAHLIRFTDMAPEGSKGFRKCRCSEVRRLVPDGTKSSDAGKTTSTRRVRRRRAVDSVGATRITRRINYHAAVDTARAATCDHPHLSVYTGVSRDGVQLSFDQTPIQLNLIHATRYTSFLYVIDFKYALNFGKAQFVGATCTIAQTKPESTQK
jgi:hypothetical protein